MNKPTEQIEIRVTSTKAEQKLKKANDLAEKLRVALDDLKNIEIGIDIVNVKKHWWMFWK